MKNLLLGILIIFFSKGLWAQTISIQSGWKFKTGDDSSWSNPHLDDQNWKPISIGKSWEEQGYAKYNGFAWYRLHIVIPSSIKDSFETSQWLLFELGKIDDCDEFYLNGDLIGTNGGANNDIKKSSYAIQRSYMLPVTDKRILWNKENVLAVRVWDQADDGGMYEGKYGIRRTALHDFVQMYTNDSVSFSESNKTIYRKISLSASKGIFSGALLIIMTDTASNQEVFHKEIPVVFSEEKSFDYTWPVPVTKNGSFLFNYTYTDAKSGEKLIVTEKQPYIPSNKNLEKNWPASLYKRENQKIYQGDELKHIAMPCGGIGAGQIEITGKGIISPTESIHNIVQQPNAGMGFSNGYQYLNPQAPSPKFEIGFAIRIREPGQKPQTLHLNGKDFDSLQFSGEYPIAKLSYWKSGEQLPVRIDAEVFSPFIPLDLRNSANPVTVQRFIVSNTSRKKIEITLAGWMQNDSVISHYPGLQNSIKRSKGISSILLGEDVSETNRNEATNRSKLFPKGDGSSFYGNTCLSILDDNAMATPEDISAEDCFKGLKDGNFISADGKSVLSNSVWGGKLSTDFILLPGQTRTITFLITWYFPNYYDTNYNRKTYAGHIYNNWYKSSFEVAKYTAANFNSLYQNTKLFQDIYLGNSLPEWLNSRIAKPLSTLACGNIQVWENGRMYGYEGVGFCPGTTGHVYNFVPTISKLFPELERSERLMQDLNDSAGYSPSGRINFRGHDGISPDAETAYASDAQCGYVLKLYREHLMSPDMHFLDSVWNKTKSIIGYLIFRDGGGLGRAPDGVLEDLQTFWDPMWYGPNPYNNTLYLAALRAAEEMARLKGENTLADRYHALYLSGQTYMTTKMWNGEYFVHLYPNGFSGTTTSSGFASSQDVEDNAKGFTEAFNQNEPNYYMSTSCDAQQLFGQNWANQLGLGYILPAEKCLIAAKNIFLLNWTPDIATIYDYKKPLSRILAASGEAVLVNGSWPYGKPKDFPKSNYMPDYNFEKSFENIWDKTDAWCGLEYEAACDMINEGLIDEGLTVIRGVDQRYDAKKRNPWNEIEGSDHYARSMHSWNILVSLSGFEYDGPAGKIGFSPKINAEKFKCFFSAAEGWGSFSQEAANNIQRENISVSWGKIRLRTLKFSVLNNWTGFHVNVKLNGNDLNITSDRTRASLIVHLPGDLLIKAGEQLEVSIYP